MHLLTLHVWCTLSGMDLLYILHKQHNELPVSAHCHSYFTCQNALKVPIYLYAVYVSTTLFLLVNNAIKSWSWWCLVQAKYLCVCLESGSGVGVFLTLSLSPFCCSRKLIINCTSFFQVYKFHYSFICFRCFLHRNI